MQSKRRELTANIQEIFGSIQGEGLYVGVPMLFVRFSNCDLRCDYCDTKRSWKPQKFCRYEAVPFTRKFQRIPNELTVNECARLIQGIRLKTPYLVFTGGEPLLATAYILALIKRLGKGKKYFLETNGVLSKNIEKLLGKIDIFSVDLKQGYEQEFKNTIKILEKTSQEYYIKVVIDKKYPVKRLWKTLSIIDRKVKIIFQPKNNRLDRNFLIRLIAELASKKLNYLIIPQNHKILNIA